MRTFSACGAFLLTVSASSGVASSASHEQAPASGKPVVQATPAAPAAASSAQKGRVPVETGLVGSIVLGPGTGLAGVGGRGSKPVADAKVIVSQREDGPEIASTLTDTAGHYEVTLPPGTYRVTLETTVSYRLTKDLPATVTVSQGKATTLHVLLDTGIR
jgi:Carboxypeptidase regulatory-like domain